MRRVLLTTPMPLRPDGSWPKGVPDHYAFGTNHFRALGYEVLTLPAVTQRGVLDALRHLPGRAGTRYGDVALQIRAYAEHRRADLLFDPWDIKGNVLCLAALRACGALRRPLVGYVHSQPLAGTPGWQRPARELFLTGCDALPAMSPSVAHALTSRPAWAGKTTLVRPGPDASYYVPESGAGSTIVCVGKSLRDFETLGLAASRTTARVHIVCPRSAVTPAFGRFAANVEVTAVDDGRLLTRRQIDPLLRKALAVAIPLSTTRLMAGLWSLFDGLGFARPVLMTRHPGVPVDLEGERIGRWIDVGDTTGWADALQFVTDHPDEAHAMGRRARALVDAGFDSRTFAREMVDVFDTLLGITATGRIDPGKRPRGGCS